MKPMNDPLVRYIHEIENLKSSGAYPEAKKLVDTLLVQYTDDYRLYEELADIYLYQGDLVSAESSMKIAQDLNTNSATGMYLMGYIAVSRGEFKKGIDLLSQANENFPNNPEILRNLGWAFTVTGKGDKGIFLLKRALNLAPDDVLIMEDLGVALLSDGTELTEAEDLLRRAGKEHRIPEIRALMRI